MTDLSIFSRLLRFAGGSFLALCMALLVVFPAQSAWWEFGRSDGEPVITDIKFNQVDVSRAEDTVVLTKEDLQGGVLTLRGRAEVRRGIIGLVEFSLDGGQKWSKATIDERGAFTAELRLDLERDYDFRLHAITTTGQKSDVEDHSFLLKVSAANPQEEVRKAFAQLLQAYMQENRSAFMRLVSPDFEGNEAALEDAITDDFRYLDNIRIDAQISRVAQFDRDYEVSFNFNRQVTSARTGRPMRDAAASTVSFRRDGEGFKLSRMAAPLIFGLSGQTEVASSVTTKAVGTTVISIDPKTGEISTGAQSSSVPTAASSGRATLTTTYSGMGGPKCDAFSFETDDTQTNQACGSGFTGDVLLEFMSLRLNSGVTAQKLSSGFDSTAMAPESGYLPDMLVNLATGNVYALKLLSGKYVLLEVTSFAQGTTTPGTTLQLRYKYQPSGSRNF